MTNPERYTAFSRKTFVEVFGDDCIDKQTGVN